MATLATVTALLVAFVNGLAGLLGGIQWWRVEVPERVWILVRAGQVAAIAMALVAGGVYVAGARPDDGLFWLYMLLPVVVNLLAEQFRLTAAQTVLDARGLEDAQAVGRLPSDQQRSVVLQIVRRELGVMVLAALVTAFLALRAVTETGGL